MQPCLVQKKQQVLRAVSLAGIEPDATSGRTSILTGVEQAAEPGRTLIRAPVLIMLTVETEPVVFRTLTFIVKK